MYILTNNILKLIYKKYFNVLMRNVFLWYNLVNIFLIMFK